MDSTLPPIVRAASPHTRGWTPGEKGTAQVTERASPHTRGWTRSLPNEWL